MAEDWFSFGERVQTLVLKFYSLIVNFLHHNSFGGRRFGARAKLYTRHISIPVCRCRVTLLPCGEVWGYILALRGNPHNCTFVLKVWESIVRCTCSNCISSSFMDLRFFVTLILSRPMIDSVSFRAAVFVASVEMWGKTSSFSPSSGASLFRNSAGGPCCIHARH